MSASDAMNRVRRYVAACMSESILGYLGRTGMTQAELARRAGLNPSLVSYMVSGWSGSARPKIVSLGTAVAVAVVTGMSLDEMCGLDRLREEMEAKRRDLSDNE